ncbi:MAG: dihydrofolate reductase [Duncaniella sp.]|uniref:dihydrofolate reductase n=1 Tax=Duncaniella sp. TaxID=2518496 RepID=UPI0023D296B8|nr:dihydrofolate reductase [Duncaniella sp.]MDE6089348.1 dihydrofolate reductase [Duncaniella sp.]
MKPEVILIVAVTRNFAIGRGGDLLFHISDDLKRFKSITMGCPIIMGRKTFESFPKGALPGRRNIVVTRNPDYTAPGIEVASSVEEAIAMCVASPVCFVIGGGEIYTQALPRASKIELTLIDEEIKDADTFFPVLSSDEWTLPSSPVFDLTDPRSGARYAFITLKRKKD